MRTTNLNALGSLLSLLAAGLSLRRPSAPDLANVVTPRRPVLNGPRRHYGSEKGGQRQYIDSLRLSRAMRTRSLYEQEKTQRALMLIPRSPGDRACRTA